MFLLLDYSGHYPPKIVDITEDEYDRLLKVQGKRYLYDTEEGRRLLTELESRALRVESIIAYI